ncbi:MAG: DUF2207 domain-containing protein [Candidatus Promineifilaceae bacterium]|nr:DUF2207 domain-containing protein [Candidatus Promineifilaceae bacterium]
MNIKDKQPQRVILLIAALFIFLFFSQSASAQIKSFRWENWESDITLLENGDFNVEETHTIEFSGEPFTFGFRTIRTGSSGGNDAITNIAVREGDIIYSQSNNRSPHTYTVSEDGDEVTIRWYFEPALGQHTYTFSYTVEGGVATGMGQEGESDEIFWTIVPDDHPGLISNSSATIHLPEGVQPQKYTGTSDYIVAGYQNNELNDAIVTQVSEDGQVIYYENTQPLVEGQSFEVRTQFATGLLAIETPNWQRQEQIGDTISLFLFSISLLCLVVGPLLVLLLWYLRGRDPQLTIVVPEYISEPPDNLPPAVVGTLIDEKADMQDIVSTMIDLANRGYLTMTEEDSNHVFTRTEKSTSDLRPFEKQFVKDIFGKKNEKSLNDLRYKFASKLPNLRNMVYQELVDEELVPKSPHSIRRSYGCFAGLLFGAAVAGFFLFTAIWAETVDTIICIPVTLGITALLMLFVARHMPKKTAKGTEAAAKWSAFKHYLKNIEHYADLEESSEIFAKYLGYAVAFGLERTWIRKFSTVPATPIPPWYFPYYGGYYGGLGGGTAAGSGGSGSPQMPTLQGMSGSVTGGLSSMSAGLTRMLNSTSTVLKSTPPSSRSGGTGSSFSGGFSGGGFSAGGGGSAGFG